MKIVWNRRKKLIFWKPNDNWWPAIAFLGFFLKFLIPIPTSIPKIWKIYPNPEILWYQSQSQNFEKSTSIPMPKIRDWARDLSIDHWSQQLLLSNFFYKFILISTFLLWLASVLREVLWRSGGPGVKSSGLGSFEQFIGQYLFLHLKYKRLAKCIWAVSKFFKQNSK